MGEFFDSGQAHIDNGNFTAYLTGAVAGNSSTLQSYEPIFQQGSEWRRLARRSRAAGIAGGRRHMGGGFVFAESSAGAASFIAQQPGMMPCAGLMAVRGGRVSGCPPVTRRRCWQSIAAACISTIRSWSDGRPRGA